VFKLDLLELASSLLAQVQKTFRKNFSAGNYMLEPRVVLFSILSFLDKKRLKKRT
jgi:hypothetical protein